MTAIDNLSKALSKLPGVGPKSAARIAFHLVKTPDEYNRFLSECIGTIKEKIRPCSVCGAYSESEICSVCSDPTRDVSLLCIVEQPQDVITIQNSGVYNGLFHVLGGTINPLNACGPENLNFGQLLQRVRQGKFAEIIIATNPTEEGDTTALYIRKFLKDFEGLKFTRLASGLPVGGDLEFADRSMLIRSLRGRIGF